jgi:beta-mannosidase
MGIRTINLVREKDTPLDNQLSFKFTVNGVAIFAKGANYVPRNFFLPSGLREPGSYDELIDNAIGANFNMIRVWGGGYYENDYFYELCDKIGIMIWQDFMFANSMYPGTSGFLENVKSEAKYQIQRLRNHPSVAFWCGNNEILQGWREWGWSSLGSDLWIWFQMLFDLTLPDMLAAEDPDKSYINSSPLSTYGYDLNSGDVHYWAIWWGGAEVNSYWYSIGRFNTEFGMQSLTPISSIKQFIPTDE